MGENSDLGCCVAAVSLYVGLAGPVRKTRRPPQAVGVPGHGAAFLPFLLL